MLRSALFSPDRTYRYLLTRTWAEGPTILWLMLNPSTADAERDDPTIRRCIAFSRRFGFARLEVANLYALRTPPPSALRAHPSPVGPDTDAHLAAAAARADTILAAWGHFPFARPHAREVLALLPPDRLRCLGLTRSGAPRHPLYLHT